MKPDIYNGSAPLREFLAQFNLIAQANRWGAKVKAAVLVPSEEEGARGVRKCAGFRKFRVRGARSKVRVAL